MGNEETLNIGTQLPKQFATKVQFIGAKRDSGKTYTAGVEEEECLKLGIPMVIIDPMHAHYGLRDKYKIPVLGPIDKYAKDFQPDIDISSDDGETIARMVVNLNQDCILDLANWDKDTMCEFMAEFGEKLYQLNNSPRHIFVEEADIFAPQSKVTTSSKRSKIVLNDLVRRGRGKGLGITLITQRVQVIDKDIVTQSDLFLFMNFTAHHDLNVIKDYIKTIGAKNQKVLNTLEKIKNFKQGECLLYSPSWLDRLEIFKVRPRTTYHAGRTPEFDEVYTFKPLEINIEPITLELNKIVNPTQTKPDDISNYLTRIAITVICLGSVIGLVIIYGT